jgi:hypothetical protein
VSGGPFKDLIPRRSGGDSDVPAVVKRLAERPEEMVDVPAPDYDVTVPAAGRPLDTDTRTAMEARFGHDFGRIRVHSDTSADESARALGARAYTVGDHIVFAAGEYTPSTAGGSRLLAHELTHVVQERSISEGSPSRDRPLLSHVDDIAEREAEAVASADPRESVAVTQEPSAVVHGGWLGATLGALAGAVVGGLIGLVAGPVGAIVGGVIGGLVGGIVGGVATRDRPGFRTVRTAYGTFLVYPDNFVGPLPVPDRTSAEGWPVREAVFARIQEVIDAISGGTSTIVIDGTDAFRTSVLTDLAWLMTVDVGRELIAAITATGKTLTIESTAGGNATSYDPDADSWENADGTPGAGSDVTVSYNTEEWNPYGGDEDWMRRPPAIGLAHEMVHAWTGMTGTRARGETEGVRRRELQATGLGEFSAARLTENRFREAFGMPLRPRY